MKQIIFCVLLVFGISLTFSVAIPMIKCGKLSGNSVFVAMREKDFDALESSLNRTNVNFKDLTGWTPLLEATKMRNVPMVDTDDYNTSPLLLAAFQGDSELVDYYIRLEANLDQLNQVNLSPLGVCAFHDDTTIAELLLESGAGVSKPAFFWALLATNMDLVEMLIEKGADVTIPLRHGYIAHHVIFFSVAEKRKILGLLRQYGFTVPLKFAERDVTELAELIINEGAQKGIWAGEGDGALHMAASDPHHLKAASVLIRNGAGLDCRRPSDFKNPLHIAIQKNNTGMVKLLLDNGANPKITMDLPSCDDDEDIFKSN